LKAERALAIVRVAVGAIFVARTTPLLAALGFRFAPHALFGWPTTRWHVALVVLPAWLAAALAILRTLAAVAFAAGWRARASGIFASLAGWLALAGDPLAYVNSLHLLFLATFLVALADVRSPVSSLWLVRALPMSVYFFSAVAKLNAQFLSGRALLDSCDDGYLRGAIARVACASPERAHGTSLFVVVGELAMPIALAFPRTRPIALAAAVFFHLVIETSMHPDVFGWVMLALLVAFIPGLRRARDRSRT